MKITIRNWDKYNKRKDLKRPWWFALNNRLLEDTDFYSLSGEEIKSWIYILSQASKERKAEIEICFFHAERSCNVKISALKTTISKLLEKGILVSPDRDPNVIRSDADRDPTSTLQDSTIQDNTVYLQQKGLLETEIARVYAKYPRRVGKEPGYSKLRTNLKTMEDLQLFEKAVDAYRDFCAKEGRDIKYIKQFSSFVTNWREWLDPSNGSGESFKASGGLSQADWDEIHASVRRN